MRGRGTIEMTPFKAGLMFATVVAVVVFFVFGKSNPFEHPFILKAAFQNASNIGLNSPVRIAGVEVGRVSGLDRKPDSSAAVVTMKIRRDGLPIPRDAELKIRPRIFLEGNFFVDLSPGTPQARNLHSGNTVPLAQTASPVQLDQVLTSLQADTRRDLQTLVQGYGDALYGKPLPGEDQAAGADRSTRGERASKSLNDSLRDAPDALRGVAIVNQALLGTQVHDLSRFIAGQAKISRALASREGSLKDRITNLNTTTGGGERGAAHQGDDPAAPAGRPREQVPEGGDPAEGRREAHRPAAVDRPAELQGVLADAGEPLGRVPELRRERPIHALPARRRRSDGLDRRAAGSRPALRKRGHQADRLASEAARAQAAVQPQVPLLQEQAAEPQLGADGTRTVSLAIRKHAREFVALIALVLVALAVAGYILGNQRLELPSWAPFVGKSFYTVNAEFSTAQAVVPGQGQTVDIAGVPVGQIGSVRLEHGVASVKLEIRKKYSPIYRDARLLLRPKTGLKDMIVEMDPGNRSAGALPSGATLPVDNSAPDVNPDEILPSLDADPRADLTILLNPGARAFSHAGYAVDLRQTLKRFEPTNRDLAKITGELSKRRKNIAHVVHDLALLTTELGRRDNQIASLVTSSNANFRALASQDANIRASLRVLPGTLSTAQSPLGKAEVLANHLGPTLQDLRPTARALGPALAATRPFLHDTTPLIQNQLRPFARGVRQPA